MGGGAGEQEFSFGHTELEMSVIHTVVTTWRVSSLYLKLRTRTWAPDRVLA